MFRPSPPAATTPRKRHAPRQRSRASVALIVAATLAAGSIRAQDAERPLFAGDSVLELSLEAGIRDLSPNDEERPEIDGILRYREADGRDMVLSVGVRLRGKSRLTLCDFPPLRLDFKRSELDGTVFEGQDHLKLVTLCKRRDDYRDYLAQEYQIYQAYNALTDVSFRVRPLMVEYLDTAARRPEPFVERAFFIEEDWEVAERHGLEALDVEALQVADLDSSGAALLALFHYMIGNTDWSPISAAPDEDCCHNGKPVGIAGRPGVQILPYDFDFSGLIDADYATPRSHLPIRSVRHRLYRGYCANNAELDGAVRLLNDRREAIERVFDSEPVSERTRARTLDYLAEFYEVINDPAEFRDEIIDDCR